MCSIGYFFMQGQAGGSRAVFELMDILRYHSPHVFPADTPGEIREAMEKHKPVHLYDIYLLSDRGPVCALLHPAMYPRILRGWLRIGSRVQILQVVGDMICRMETVPGLGNAAEITALKHRMYLTTPAPIYNESTCYLPLLSDEGYLKWDRRWKTELEPYIPSLEDVPVPVENIETTASDDPSLLFSKHKRIKNKAGYTNTKCNLLAGCVLLKSKLFMSEKSESRTSIVFSFVLRAREGLVKAYVWGECVRRFFCLGEGDRVVIRGFKIKRRKGELVVTDRKHTDADLPYAQLPEISVNATDPVGNIYILAAPLDPLCPFVFVPEYTTARGLVEYVSPLLRWREQSRMQSRVREFVYLRVAGACIKLFSDGPSENILRIAVGKFVEIRHLRSCRLGDFPFYISSLHTQTYLEPQTSTNVDAEVLECPPQGTGVEGGVGYLPCGFLGLDEYFKAAEHGLGPLYVNGQPISRASHNSLYLRKEYAYYGCSASIAQMKERSECLYMDEIKRYVTSGYVRSIRYKNTTGAHIKSAPSTDQDIDVTYRETEHSLEVIGEKSILGSSGISEAGHITADSSTVAGLCSFTVEYKDRKEESMVLRIEEEGEHIDLHVFRNHLLPDHPFEAALQMFFKAGADTRSIYEHGMQYLNQSVHFVTDATRVDEDTILYIGVALLKT